MCTFVILRRPDHAWPVIIAANRDEMINRAFLPPARHWPDRAEVLGGMDVLAGGTWLAVNETGVAAGILNRHQSLGPQVGRRSRGELVLEALDHPDAKLAAASLREVEPSSYRPFNLILADNRDAYWLRHADPTGIMRPIVTPLPPGLSMITAGDLDDPNDPRIGEYRGRFADARPPDPDADDWSEWESLLSESTVAHGAQPTSAMNFTTSTGFATLISTLIAIPAIGKSEARPIFRFALRRPQASEWQALMV